MELMEILKSAVEKKASDIFIISGLAVTYKENGIITKQNDNMILPAEAEKLTHCITVSQGVQLNELFSQIKKQLDFNGNIPLTLLALGGKIKDITEK